MMRMMMILVIAIDVVQSNVRAAAALSGVQLLML